MSNIDKKYIDALDAFTGSLEEVVKLLKEQQKNNKADTTNEMLTNVPTSNLQQVIKDLKEITEKGFSDLKQDNQEILKNIESVRQQRESGMFESVEDPRNKNKIVDGIKVVILIAAGVLALGMAFKIIGKVDFLSVVALSTAMFSMATAYSKIAAVKNLKYSDILKIASVLPIMAAGLALSGFILTTFPNFSLMQGISIMLISGALGIATSLLLKSISKLSAKSLLMIPLIPIILPLIALGLVAASYILTNIKQLTLMQVFSVALVGLALGVATVGISLALRGLKNVTWKEMMMLPLMIPLIAGGIVLASLIFQGFMPINNPLQLLIGSAVIGLSMLFFVPTVLLLGKMKTTDVIQGLLSIIPMAYVMTEASILFQNFIPLKNPLLVGLSSLSMGLSILLFVPAIWVLGKMNFSQILKGTLGLLAVAGAILATAYIFAALPDVMKFPSFMWTLGAGLSVLVFALAVTGIGLLATLLSPFFWTGLLAILAVAGSIAAVSWILQKGNYAKYPTLEWAVGSGASLLAFSLAIIAASVAGLVTAVTSFFSGDIDPLVSVATSMVNVSKALVGGVWDGKYPTYDWALGVGTTLVLFATATAAGSVAGLASKIIGFFSGDTDPLLTLAKSMVSISFEMQKGKWDGNYPTFDWATGVGTAMTLFAAITVVSGGSSAIKSFVGLFTGDKDPLMTLAQSMVDVSLKLHEGKWESSNATKEWVTNITDTVKTYMAVVDNLKELPEMPSFDNQTSSISKLANSFLTLANSLSAVNNNLQGFTNLSKGLFLISVIDDVKFDNVLKSVDKYKESLQVINQIPEEQVNLLAVIKGLSENLSTNKETNVKVDSTRKDDNSSDNTKQFYSDISDIKSLLYDIKESMDKPSQAGSFYK